MDLSRFNIPPGEEDPVYSIIQRRRRQLIVHSIIYYKFGEELIPDSTWDQWAKDLLALQKAYPDKARIVPYTEAFEDFDGSTGFFLPLDDPSCLRTAEDLLRMDREKSNVEDPSD